MTQELIPKKLIPKKLIPQKLIPQKLIIDTDPGIDDAMAIHYAFADARLEVLGLTTIFGNVWTAQATRNALFLAEQAHYDVPVVGGAETPLIQPANPPAHHVHGTQGLGDNPAPHPHKKPDPRKAADFLIETCRQHGGEVILCPIGPLTNIAQMLEADPDIVRYVQRLVIMGGAVWTKGNVTKWAEANIWNDPHAADKVFAADWQIDLIGLDVTQQIDCTSQDFARLRQTSPQIGGFLHEISDFYIQFYASVLGAPLCLLHDPAALVAIMHRELFSFRTTPLHVSLEGETIGQTISDETLHRRGINVAIAADREKIAAQFFDVCAGADKQAQARQK